MAAANFVNAVREYWRPGVVEQVIQEVPLLTKFALARKMIRRGGKSITFPVDMDEGETAAVGYGPNEPMGSSKREFLERPEWSWKKFRVDIEWDEEEASEGTGGPATAPVDLVKTKTEKALRQAKYKLLYDMYRSNTDGTSSTTTDADTGNFQGLTAALNHDAAYGGITRTIATPAGTYWQSASISGAYTDQNTNYEATLDNFRKVMEKVTQYGSGKPGGYLAIMGAAIFRKFQAQLEAKSVNTKLGETSLAKFGFTSMEVDGVEFVLDPFLNRNVWGTTSGSKTDRWFFVIHVPDWELHLFPGRDLTTVRPGVFQGDIIGGYDKYLARVLVKGNMICGKPNASYWGSYWT